MLSNQCAKILLLIRNQQFDEIIDFNTFKFLQEKKYIEYSPDKTAYLSPLGEEVLDDYLHAQELKSIAEKANKKADRANILALISLVVSILVFIFKQ